MNFVDTRYLYAIVPALAILLLLRGLGAKVYGERLALLSKAFRIRAAKERWDYTRRILLALALISMLLSLARPRWDFHWTEVKHRGSDIMVVLDLSRSMLADDQKPNRLERAKRSIRDLLSAIQGDRIGLILFSGSAFIQCPLTYDRGSFELFLSEANTELLPEQGTEIASALNLAEKAFDEGSEAGSRGRTVLLISDGEDHGESAIEAARTLANKGARIFTLGVGTDGAPIPSEAGGFLKDSLGQLVISKPDLKGLGDIASAGGGRLLSANEALDDFYKAELGHGDELKSSREKVWVERHMHLSALAFALLCLELVLSFARRPFLES